MLGKGRPCSWRTVEPVGSLCRWRSCSWQLALSSCQYHPQGARKERKEECAPEAITRNSGPQTSPSPFTPGIDSKETERNAQPGQTVYPKTLPFFYHQGHIWYLRCFAKWPSDPRTPIQALCHTLPRAQWCCVICCNQLPRLHHWYSYKKASTLAVVLLLKLQLSLGLLPQSSGAPPLKFSPVVTSLDLSSSSPTSSSSTLRPGKKKPIILWKNWCVSWMVRGTTFT